ncbi:hypothetical protein NKH18_36970 [Streptomyces sp. M10(2022)]
MELGKPAGDGGPPAVHDQRTVTSMPNAGTGPIPTPGPGIRPARGRRTRAADRTERAGSCGPARRAVRISRTSRARRTVRRLPGYPGTAVSPAGPRPRQRARNRRDGARDRRRRRLLHVRTGRHPRHPRPDLRDHRPGRAKRGEATNAGMALAGIVLGSVAIAISAMFLGFIIWAIASSESSSGNGFDYSDPYSTSLVVGATR